MESFISCPECGYENSQGTTSCKRCLLVFEKFEKKSMKTNSVVSGGTRLENIWKELLSDYGNMDLHEKFITQALSEKNLPFASQQYRKMRELNPADDIAVKMIDKIIQVATLAYAQPMKRPAPVKKMSLGTKLIAFTISLLVLSCLAVLWGHR